MKTLPDCAWNVVNVEGFGWVVLNLVEEQGVGHGQVILVGASGGGRCRRTVQGALHGGNCKQGGGFAINFYVWGWAQKTLGRVFALLVHPMQPSVLLVLRLPDQARLLQDHDLLHELAELWLAD